MNAKFSYYANESISKSAFGSRKLGFASRPINLMTFVRKLLRPWATDLRGILFAEDTIPHIYYKCNASQRPALFAFVHQEERPNPFTYSATDGVDLATK